MEREKLSLYKNGVKCDTIIHLVVSNWIKMCTSQSYRQNTHYAFLIKGLFDAQYNDSVVDNHRVLKIVVDCRVQVAGCQHKCTL